MGNRQHKIESGMNAFTVEEYQNYIDFIIATNRDFTNEEYIVENGKIYLIIHY